MRITKSQQCYPDHYFTLARFHSLFATGLPILLYHKIGRPGLADRRKGLFVSKHLLAWQLTELRQANYRFAGLENQGGERRVAISFDDGYLSCFEEAMPVLNENGCRAIQYVTIRSIGKTNDWDHQQARIMDKSQISQWLSAGHLIGSHALSHRDLTRLEPREAQREIHESKKWLEDNFGFEVRHFSYPYGARNRFIEETVEEAGYATAVTVDFGVNDNSTNKYRFRRIPAYGSVPELLLALMRSRRR